MFGKAYELQESGKLLFPTWEAAINYIELYNLRNFRLERMPDGKALLDVRAVSEGGSKAG